MERFKYQLIRALLLGGGVSSFGMGVSGCGDAQASDAPEVGVVSQGLTLSELGKTCGFVCPGQTDAEGVKVKTLLEGNASISGVPSVDGFFTSVVNFQTAAKSVASGIDAELEAIRVDFQLPANADIGTALKAKLDANLEAGFALKVEPPVCKADFRAELDAAARCDAEVSGGKVEVECKGGCDVEAKADLKCDAAAELRCTVTAPEIECKGECTGKCNVELTAAASCSGTCKGECTGNCSAYTDKAGTQCAGSCSGMCKGTCETEVSADASCSGKCSGECTQTRAADAGCEGGIRAQCKAKANASIKCDTKCDGTFEPPSVKAECQAKVHADAKLNVQCTPPHVAFNYRIKASASLTLEERLRFESALKNLVDVRLPAIKAALKRGGMVTEAGADLVAAADGAFKGAIDAARAKAGVDIKVAFGLGCAVNELPNVKKAIDASTATLKTSVEAANKINAALKI